MDKMKITSILIITCLIIVGTTCFATTGIVNAPNGLVLREEASKNANPLATISDDSNVEIIEQSGEWYKVNYNGKEGYLFAEYVDVEEEEVVEENNTLEEQQSEEYTTETQYPQTQKAKANLKVYILPSVTSKTIINVEMGEEITINYDLNNWINVTYNGKIGWARKYFINNRLIVDSFLKFFKKCTLIFLTIVKICFNIHQPIWFIRR